MMRYQLAVLFTGSIAAGIIFFNTHLQHATSEAVPAEKGGFAVIELFTSEGCSSCPSADEAVTTISGTYKDKVFVLGFHVDYWNRLGWKDEFSSAAYSDRQRKYANVLGLEGVYTPQVVVNGREEFVGSDNSRLERAVKQGLSQAGNQDISITVENTNENKVEAAYEANATEGTLLNIALVQVHAVTNVRRGENSGRKLSHINIVRDFKTVMTGKGKVSLNIPEGLTAAECKIISYLQDRHSFKVSGATETLLK